MALDQVTAAREAMSEAFERLTAIRADIATCLEGLKNQQRPERDNIIRQHMQLEVKWQQTYTEYARLHNEYLEEIKRRIPVPFPSK